MHHSLGFLRDNAQQNLQQQLLQITNISEMVGQEDQQDDEDVLRLEDRSLTVCVVQDELYQPPRPVDYSEENDKLFKQYQKALLTPPSSTRIIEEKKPINQNPKASRRQEDYSALLPGRFQLGIASTTRKEPQPEEPVVVDPAWLSLCDPFEGLDDLEEQ